MPEFYSVMVCFYNLFHLGLCWCSSRIHGNRYCSYGSRCTCAL